MTSPDTGGGLDLGTVAAALPSRADREHNALDLLTAHTTTTPGYLAWSGGKDSTAVLALAARAGLPLPVVWFDSGLEFPETRTYIAQIADLLDVDLHVIRAQPDALTVLETTGVWDHAAVYNPDVTSLHTALITAPAAAAHSRFGPGEVTGLRAGESTGRRILLATGNGRYTRTDGSTVCAPIWRWSDLDVRGYLTAAGIPLNPVYARLEALGAPPRSQRVGLVVDANSAEHGRFTWLRAGWPDLYDQIAQRLPRLREWR